MRTFVSLLLRPIVCPEVSGGLPAEVDGDSFFAPGSLVSNLDFVESIFGNAGDPFLPRNDAGLDVEHWTGHTGCVILAPHLSLGDQEGTGASARLRRPRERQQRRRDVLEERKRKVQRRRSVQAHLPHGGGGDRDAAGRQLFRLLQEGGENADQLRGQSVRQRGGRARGRGDRLCQLQLWR